MLSCEAHPCQLQYSCISYIMWEWLFVLLRRKDQNLCTSVVKCKCSAFHWPWLMITCLFLLFFNISNVVQDVRNECECDWDQQISVYHALKNLISTIITIESSKTHSKHINIPLTINQYKCTSGYSSLTVKPRFITLQNTQPDQNISRFK